MDAIEKLGLIAERCAVCMGRTDTGEYLLIQITTATDEEKQAARESAIERGFRFCGLIGTLPNGQLAVEVEPGDSEALAVTIRAIPAYIILPLPVPKKDDSVQFLENLYKLEDTRQ